MRVGILGGAGYTGGELIRLLLDHPQAKLVQVASSTFAGQPVYCAHPNLQGRTKLVFDEALDAAALDCIFLAGEHGAAMKNVPLLLEAGGKDLKIIDLSADFRLQDAALYPAWYGREHTASDLLPQFVYGLTEVNHDAVAGAQFIANPGCFATAVSLALAPLAVLGVTGTARISAITGSSGSGAKAASKTHHPTRDGSVHAYKPLEHQHTPEVEQLLVSVAGKTAPKLAIVPVSGPMVRGIYAVCHLELPQGADGASVGAAFEKAYANRPFIRLQDSPPHLNAATGSNYCDIHWTVKDNEIAVIVSLDNLVKGAAGQAVQNLNVMMGWDETDGLTAAGIYPG
ncbi:MAG: N-acetyl-gamma-glutamyl-phosphate reductase [Elusimicrobia bacterium]|nr:MAG: N-acetyl-gamma-glutamyl-phosphate reductase [Elusimicrobiota bacterium]